MHIFIISTKCMHDLNDPPQTVDEVGFTNCMPHNENAAEND